MAEADGLYRDLSKLLERSLVEVCWCQTIEDSVLQKMIMRESRCRARCWRNPQLDLVVFSGVSAVVPSYVISLGMRLIWLRFLISGHSSAIPNNWYNCDKRSPGRYRFEGFEPFPVVVRIVTVETFPFFARKISEVSKFWCPAREFRMYSMISVSVCNFFMKNVQKLVVKQVHSWIRRGIAEHFNPFNSRKPVIQQSEVTAPEVEMLAFTYFNGSSCSLSYFKSEDTRLMMWISFQQRGK